MRDKAIPHSENEAKPPHSAFGMRQSSGIYFSYVAECTWIQNTNLMLRAPMIFLHPLLAVETMHIMCEWIFHLNPVTITKVGVFLSSSSLNSGNDESHSNASGRAMAMSEERDLNLAMEGKATSIRDFLRLTLEVIFSFMQLALGFCSSNLKIQSI
eukprot:Gb_10564 [translate_table: standard]